MQLQLLWKLQEYDLAISDLESKIESAPALSGKDELVEQLSSLKEDIESRESWLKEVKKTLKSLELRTQKIVDDRKEMHESMYGGKIGNVKELEQMQRRMDHLAAEKEGLEEKIITHMETIEELEELIKDNRSSLKDLEKELTLTEEKLAEEIGALQAELNHLAEKRAALASHVSERHLERYTNMRERHGGIALASAGSDICGACRVFISSALRGHLYNPDAMVYCENCGRLLVKIED